MNQELEQQIINEVPKDDSTSHGEKMLLYWLVRELKPKTVIETGTHRGLTSLYITAALKDNGEGHLTTCDPNPEWYASGNFAKFPELLPHVTYKQVMGKDLDVMDVDFAFIDGFHGYKDVVEELQMLVPKLNKTAVVVFHDCWYSNTAAVNEAIEDSGLQSIWLGTKNAIRIYSKHPEKPTDPKEL